MADECVELGLVLYRCRLERGLSQRALARKLGLSAHSSLVDFEKGRRLPPEYLLVAYEHLFGLPEASLVQMRMRLLAARAEVLVRQRLADVGPRVVERWSVPGPDLVGPL
jgi:transcriptional regulator with XRE-family HTH domain